jgi:hypothetical protein
MKFGNERQKFEVNGIKRVVEKTIQRTPAKIKKGKVIAKATIVITGQKFWTLQNDYLKKTNRWFMRLTNPEDRDMGSVKDGRSNDRMLAEIQLAMSHPAMRVWFHGDTCNITTNADALKKFEKERLKDWRPGETASTSISIAL